MNGDGGIGLIRKYVDVVVFVSNEQVVLQGPVCDRDLDNVGRAGKLLDGNCASPESGLDLSVFPTVAIILDTLHVRR